MGSIAMALDSWYAVQAAPFMRGCINRWERFVQGWLECRRKRNVYDRTVVLPVAAFLRILSTDLRLGEIQFRSERH